MKKALWNGKVLAESEQTIVVEGNHYFPPDALKMEYFQQNNHHTICSWKGEAIYYDIKVDGKVNPSAAWFYPQPKDAARQIKDHVAFWKGVEVKS